MAAKGSKCDKKLEAYKECFKKMDTDGNGYLNKDELRNMMADNRCHMDDERFKKVFEFFEGPDGDQKITFEEFCKGLDKMVCELQGLKDVFDRMDTDKSGFLDKGELTKVLQCSGQQFSREEIDAILKEADTNGDNKISFEEFLAAVC